MKRLVVLFFFLFCSLFALAQGIRGRVADVSGAALPAVSVRLVETNQYTITDTAGLFTLPVNSGTRSVLTIELSCIGFQKISRQFTPGSAGTNLGTIVMKELNLRLDEIQVNARRSYEGSSNSSLIIGRDIIEQVPALSLNDLLNQIPNKKVAPPSLQAVQNVTLRSSFSPVSSGRNIYEMNNAFGVAIIVDGNAISNNFNMQSFNPGIYGSNALSTTIGVGSYGLNGSPTSNYTGDFAFGGTDLRQIPADNIESIEVIAGVPSAKYGDLSEGAVVVERQAGRSPAYLRMQLRDNATSYGFSKGFGLGPRLGAINLGLNYVNSFADNRDKLKAYKRVNINTMWTAYFGRDKTLKNSFSVDYGRNLDGIRRDTDDPMGKIAKFNSWNFSVANRLSYRVDKPFLKNVSLNLRYSAGHQVSYTEEFSNQPYILVSDATSSGIHEGSYAEGIYTAASLIDGRPVSLSARLDFNTELKTGNLAHFLSYGASYSYGANKGMGQVLDPSRPRTLSRLNGSASGSNQSERYYDFSLAVAQNDVGLYAEDFFTARLFRRNLNVRAGLRYDLQNSLPSVAPRINVNYELSKAVRIGLAYGISYKSPGLGQRYPGPTYFEIPVVNAYNGKAAESIYLVYVNRYDPSAAGLRPANTQTLEFSTQVNISRYTLSFNAFSKNYRNGIGNYRNDQRVTLPTYTAIFRPGQQPQLSQSGTRNYIITYYSFANNLAADSYGFDLIFSTPVYKAIATSFNLSGGLFNSKNRSQNLTYDDQFGVSNTHPDFARVGIYPVNHSTSYSSNARITSTTHIPKISLFVQAVAEFDLLQKTVNGARAGIPIAYYTNDNRYVEIGRFDPADPFYGHLYKPVSQLNADNVPVIVPNFHLSIGKEIKKRFKFTFNVYNVFNYQPYYITPELSYRYPNLPPTFGAEISLKL